MIVSHSMEHRDTWVIIQITDTHLMGQAEKEFVQMNPEQSFHAVIQQILLQHPHIDAIIHTGDLAQEPEHITYQRYLSYMQGLGIPFFRFQAIMMILIIFRFSRVIMNRVLSSLETGACFY